MKKIGQVFSLLMAITIMALTLMPCADACSEISHHTEHADHSPKEHHEEHSDMCSPLCSCSCCSTQITVIHFPFISFVTPEISQYFSVYKQPFFSPFSSSIWQPPKIY